jgi:hypothetical protein
MGNLGRCRQVHDEVQATHHAIMCIGRALVLSLRHEHSWLSLPGAYGMQSKRA